jgi:hypothetical protein
LTLSEPQARAIGALRLLRIYSPIPDSQVETWVVLVESPRL